MTSRTPEEQAELERICDEDDERARRLLRERAAASIGGDAWVRDWLAGVTEASNRFAAALETAAASCSHSPEQLRHFVARVGWSGPKFVAAVDDGTWRQSLRAALARERHQWETAVSNAVSEAMGGGASAFAELGYEGVSACIHDRRLLEWAEAYDGTTGALLLGQTGIGKTAALGLVTGRLVTDHWRRSRETALAAGNGSIYLSQPTRPCLLWVRALDLGVALQRHPLGEGEPELLAAAKAAPLLLLDDLGWESRSDSIVEVLGHRYDTGAPTCVTSGLTWDALKDRYGEAVTRRPLEAGGRKGRIVNCHPQGGK